MDNRNLIIREIPSIFKEIPNTYKSVTTVEFYVGDNYIGHGDYLKNDRDKNYNWIELIIEKIAEEFGANIIREEES